jgi:RNA polymerase sigma-70 factor (ECF subfamily)
VFSLIYRMVRDRELAEDLAQDTFIKILNHIDRYRPEFKFSSWLFKVANNVAIDHLRRRQLDTVSIDGSPHAQDADAIHDMTRHVAGMNATLAQLSEFLGEYVGKTDHKLRALNGAVQALTPAT